MISLSESLFGVLQVQDSKRAYDVKHGLVNIDDQTFFDTDDDVDPTTEDEDDAPASSLDVDDSAMTKVGGDDVVSDHALTGLEE